MRILKSDVPFQAEIRHDAYYGENGKHNPQRWQLAIVPVIEPLHLLYSARERQFGTGISISAMANAPKVTATRKPIAAPKAVCRNRYPIPAPIIGAPRKADDRSNGEDKAQGTHPMAIIAVLMSNRLSVN
jgi:hypothetical protein